MPAGRAAEEGTRALGEVLPYARRLARQPPRSQRFRDECCQHEGEESTSRLGHLMSCKPVRATHNAHFVSLSYRWALVVYVRQLMGR